MSNKKQFDRFRAVTENNSKLNLVFVALTWQKLLKIAPQIQVLKFDSLASNKNLPKANHLFQRNYFNSKKLLASFTLLGILM